MINSRKNTRGIADSAQRSGRGTGRRRATGVSICLWVTMVLAVFASSVVSAQEGGPVGDGRGSVESPGVGFNAGVIEPGEVPEQIQVLDNDPNDLTAIDYADPGAQINLVQAPSANPMGDASLTYPIEVPPGRLGVQPSLGLNYSSGGGNGWVGVGWDLSIPSISVDTRWGVPRYDPARESESYLLNGEQLVPIAHRTQLADLPSRSGDSREFFRRVESDFDKIERFGTSPDNYRWLVTDKVGTQYFYGGVDSVDDNSTLSTDDATGIGNIYMWALTEIRDSHGNSVRYDYKLGLYDGTATEFVDAGSSVAVARAAANLPAKDSAVSGVARRVQPKGTQALAPEAQADAGTQVAFGPNILPGRIQAENFDVGGPGVGYSDTDPGNHGNGQNRVDEQVDVFSNVPADTGLIVGRTRGGEWLEYTVDLQVDGTFELLGHVASGFETPGFLRARINGVEVGVVEGDTGGWYEWETRSFGSVDLSAGSHVVRIAWNGGGQVNFDWFDLRRTSVPPVEAQVPYEENVRPGRVEAEHYDRGGPEVAYSDTDLGNLGHGEFRLDQDVDVFAIPGPGSGLTVGRTRGGEWLEYTIDGATAGTFELVARVASGFETPGFLRARVDGVEVGTVDGETGGWFDWAERSFGTVELHPGPQVVRIAWNGGGQVNLDWLELRSVPEPPEPPDVVPVADPGPAGRASLPGAQLGAGGYDLYPASIAYTFDPAGEKAIYRVDFATEDRPDVLVHGRGGFVRTTSQRLSSVTASLIAGADAGPVRGYEMGYIESPFGKSQLSSVAQSGADGGAFHTHTFDYWDDVTNEAGQLQGFDEAITLSTGVPDITPIEVAGIDVRDLSNFPGLDDFDPTQGLTSSALGGTESTTFGGGLYAGVGFAKIVSVGVDLSYSETESKGQLALVDVTGDSLPDIVYDGGVIQNVTGPDWPGDASAFQNLGDRPVDLALPLDESRTIAAGAKVSTPLYVDASISDVSSEGLIYFEDINGDGLTDVVNNGDVVYGQTETPAFGEAGTSPVPITDGTQQLDQVVDLEKARLRAERARRASPLIDSFRRWAPPGDAAGVATISGTASLPTCDEPCDGVHLSVEVARGTAGIDTAASWDSVLAPGGEITPEIAPVRLEPGDAIFFRVNSIDNGEFDQVEWSPTIDFVPDGGAAQQFSAVDDFLVTSRQPSSIPVTGSVTVTNALTPQLPVQVFVVRDGAEVLIADPTQPFDVTGAVTVPADGDPTVNDVSDSLRIVVPRPAFADIDLGTLGGGVTLNYADPELEVPLAVCFDVDPTAGCTPGPQEYWDSYQGWSFGGYVPCVSQAECPFAYIDDLTVFSAQDPAGGGEVDPNDRSLDGLPRGLVFQRDLQLGLMRGPDFADLPEGAAEPPTPIKDASGWIDGTTISSSRLGTDDPPSPDGPSPGSGRGVVRFSDTDQLAAGAGIAIASLGVSWGDSESALYLLDVNGDEFPDIVGDGNVQVTDPTGGYVDEFVTAEVPVADNLAFSYGLSMSTPSAQPSSSGKTVATRGSSGDRGANGTTNNAPKGGGLRSVLSKVLAPISLSASGSGGFSDQEVELLDVNADGLPDIVRRGADGLAVRLNIGYAFAEEQAFLATGAIAAGEELGTDLGLGISIDGGAISFGGSLGESRQTSIDSLMDLNGDGLIDRVDLDTPIGQVDVEFNRGGASVQGPRSWLGSDDAACDGRGLLTNVNEAEIPVVNESLLSLITSGYNVLVNDGSEVEPRADWQNVAMCDASASLGVNASLGTYITPLALVTSVSASYSKSIARPQASFRDINGDGYADHIISTNPGEMSVSLNRTGRTELLKTINRPLGGTVQIDYERQGNTFDQPQSQWTLSSAIVDDGVVGNGEDIITTCFAYGAGYFDRLEREFYGYDVVTEQHMNAGAACPAGADGIYRTIARTYENRDFHLKNTMLSEVTADGAGNRFIEATYGWSAPIVEGRTGSNPDAIYAPTALDLGSRFVRLDRIDTSYFEGQPAAGKTTFVEMTYDEFGNLKTWYDDAEPDVTIDNVLSTIDYEIAEPCRTNNIVGIPTLVSVTGGAGADLFRQRDLTVDCSTGDVTQYVEALNNTERAVTDLVYTPSGNLAGYTGPENHKGDRYGISYTYDDLADTFMATSTDSFSLTSTMGYDLRFGTQSTTVDANGERTTWTYDEFGRSATVTSPYELANELGATIEFEYFTDRVPAYAVSKHLDVARRVKTDDASLRAAEKNDGSLDDLRNSDDPFIETVVFVDGLRRAIQTKLDLDRHLGDGEVETGRSVSGSPVFDEHARVVGEFYPTFETDAIREQGVLSGAVQGQNPTTFTLDVLDRATQIQYPDPAESTTIDYDFGSVTGRDVDVAATLFSTTVTDAEANTRVEYRDVRGLSLGLREQPNVDTTIWTQFVYDALRQNTRTIDDLGNQTVVDYDLVGRQTSVNQSDAGLLEYVYDPASNLIERITPNLRRQGESIVHTYDFLRPESIDYPDNPDNNVVYRYGLAGNAEHVENNQLGRVRFAGTSAAGFKQFVYGRLGEVVEEINAVSEAGDQPNSRERYETKFIYDSFNRLQWLFYPDGEFVRYSYDASGSPRDVVGERRLFGPDNNEARSTIVYADRVSYDEFGSRVFMRHGNLTETDYGFEPVMRRLDTVTSTLAEGTKFQDLHYGYDDVGNIVSRTDRIDGGPQLDGAECDGTDGSRQEFAYDGIYRLTNAEGCYNASALVDDSYAIELAYDSIHRMESKVLDRTRTSGLSSRSEGYSWHYDYNNLFDAPSPKDYPYGVQVHAPQTISGAGAGAEGGFERGMSYDANGNLTSWQNALGGGRPVLDERADWVTVGAAPGIVSSERTLAWDEENRLMGVTDDGVTTTSFEYDYENERTIKRTPDRTTFYVNTYFTVDNRESGAKHIFLGDDRIASTRGCAPKLVLIAVPDDLDPRVDSQCIDPTELPADNADNLYYFHRDHLNSTQYVTDGTGGVALHSENLATGEPWINESTSERGPPISYEFAGNEIDKETGLYNFGRRYLDTDHNMFISVDPGFDYLNATPTFGRNPFEATLDSRRLNPYAYALNNPVGKIDPNGESAWDWAHGALDVAGLFPLAGAIPDLINAGIYAARGMPILASVSVASAIPVVGYGATGAKYVTKGADAVGAAKGAKAQVTINREVGLAAEAAIAARFPNSRRGVSQTTASGGRRVIDVLTDTGQAIESKVGRTSLTKDTRRQIARDLELLNDASSPVNSLLWEFRVSPKTGKGGPTAPLAKELDKAGIPYVVHK